MAVPIGSLQFLKETPNFEVHEDCCFWVGSFLGMRSGNVLVSGIGSVGAGTWPGAPGTSLGKGVCMRVPASNEVPGHSAVTLKRIPCNNDIG